MIQDSIRWLKSGSSGSADMCGEVSKAVSDIIRDVRSRGMDAVTEYSKRFDGFGGPFAVSAEEAASALEGLDSKLRLAVECSAENVRRFHSLQLETLKDHEWEISEGVTAGLRRLPVESTAVYIPGGRYPLVSSAIMCTVPAQAAGVRRIAAFSPPGSDGRINASVLATLSLLGVNEIWALGGVQAVAAAALGAGDIKKVDFIAGPGNAYVAEAKRQLFGCIGIDGLAGPSEVLIIADDSADARLISCDLLAQSEHDPMAKAVLITTCEELALEVTRELDGMLKTLPTRKTAELSWTNNGAVGVAGSLDCAIEYANIASPEHLQLALLNPREALEQCSSYGAAFLGHSSSEVFGDYIAGTNHTLPTDGRARFSGGLWTGSFMRTLTHLEMTPKGAAMLSEKGAAMAEAEGLAAHMNALLARSDKFKDSL